MKGLHLDRDAILNGVISNAVWYSVLFVGALVVAVIVALVSAIWITGPSFPELTAFVILAVAIFALLDLRRTLNLAIAHLSSGVDDIAENLANLRSSVEALPTEISNPTPLVETASISVPDVRIEGDFADNVIFFKVHNDGPAEEFRVKALEVIGNGWKLQPHDLRWRDTPDQWLEIPRGDLGIVQTAHINFRLEEVKSLLPFLGEIDGPTIAPVKLGEAVLPELRTPKFERYADIEFPSHDQHEFGCQLPMSLVIKLKVFCRNESVSVPLEATFSAVIDLYDVKVISVPPVNG